MKIHNFTLPFITLALVSLFFLPMLSGCSDKESGEISATKQTSVDKASIQEAKKDTEDLLSALKNYTADQRDEAIDKTKAALDKLEMQISTIESRIDNYSDATDSATRDEDHGYLKILNEQRTNVANWYNSLKISTADTWEQMKQDITKTVTALNQAGEKMEEKLRK